MNPFKVFGCRLFQKVMYVASAFLSFHEPEILDGVPEMAKKIHDLGLKKPLLVTDEGIYSLRLYTSTVEALREEGIECALYHGVVANPTFGCVEEGKKVYDGEGCDCLIALGGGSSMDAAKALAIKIAYPSRGLERFKGLLHVHRKLVPLFAIPTTAGTGSEATVAAVVVNEATKDKFQIDDPKLIPPYAVFDPYLLRDLPQKIKSTTGMDALTHAVEAYIGKSNTKKTKARAIEAMRLIRDHLVPFYETGDIEHAKEMQRAAYYAGVAFTRAYVGYVHALAHSLGGEYGVPHGLANAILLPVVLESYGRSAEKKLASIYDELELGDPSLSREAKAKAFISFVRSLNERMGIPSRFEDIVRKEDVSRLCLHAAKEGNPLYPVPKEMDANELREVLSKAL